MDKQAHDQEPTPSSSSSGNNEVVLLPDHHTSTDLQLQLERSAHVQRAQQLMLRLRDRLEKEKQQYTPCTDHLKPIELEGEIYYIDNTYDIQPSTVPPKEQVSQTMKVEMAYFDFIVGPNLSRLNRIRHDSGATIDVRETEDNTYELTVNIRGSASQVALAVKIIQDKVAQGQVCAAKFEECYNAMIEARRGEKDYGLAQLTRPDIMGVPVCERCCWWKRPAGVGVEGYGLDDQLSATDHNIVDQQPEPDHNIEDEQSEPERSGCNTK